MGITNTSVNKINNYYSRQQENWRKKNGVAPLDISASTDTNEEQSYTKQELWRQAKGLDNVVNAKDGNTYTFSKQDNWNYARTNGFNNEKEPTDRGTLDKIFGTLGYTGVVEGIYNMVDDDEESTFVSGLKEGLDYMNPLNNDVSGRHTFSDVLEAAGWEDKPDGKLNIGRGVVGFIGDVLLDPLTYLNPFSAASKVVKGTGKVTDVGKALKSVDTAIDASRKIRINSGVVNNTNLSSLKLLDLKTAEQIVKQSHRSVSDEELVEQATDLMNNFNQKVLKLREGGEDFTLGLNNLPFTNKVKVGDKTLADFKVTLAKSDKLRELGDKTIAPYYNSLAKKLRTSRFSKLFNKNATIESLADTDVYSAASLYHIDKLVKGLQKLGSDINDMKFANIIDEYEKTLSPEEHDAFIDTLESGFFTDILDYKKNVNAVRKALSGKKVVKGKPTGDVSKTYSKVPSTFNFESYYNDTSDLYSKLDKVVSDSKVFNNIKSSRFKKSLSGDAFTMSLKDNVLARQYAKDLDNVSFTDFMKPYIKISDDVKSKLLSKLDNRALAKYFVKLSNEEKKKVISSYIEATKHIPASETKITEAYHFTNLMKGYENDIYDKFWSIFRGAVDPVMDYVPKEIKKITKEEIAVIASLKGVNSFDDAWKTVHVITNKKGITKEQAKKIWDNYVGFARYKVKYQKKIAKIEAEISKLSAEKADVDVKSAKYGELIRKIGFFENELSKYNPRLENAFAQFMIDKYRKSGKYLVRDGNKIISKPLVADIPASMQRIIDSVPKKSAEINEVPIFVNKLLGNNSGGYTDVSIFDVPSNIICVPVSLDGKAKKGIITEFKKLYPKEYEAFRKQCKIGINGLSDIKLMPTEDGKIIVPIPIRTRFDKSVDASLIEASIKAVSNVPAMLKNNANLSSRFGNNFSISFPDLSFSSNSSYSNTVRNWIEKYLEPLDVPVYICSSKENKGAVSLDTAQMMLNMSYYDNSVVNGATKVSEVVEEVYTPIKYNAVRKNLIKSSITSEEWSDIVSDIIKIKPQYKSSLTELNNFLNMENDIKNVDLDKLQQLQKTFSSKSETLKNVIEKIRPTGIVDDEFIDILNDIDRNIAKDIDEFTNSFSTQKGLFDLYFSSENKINPKVKSAINKKSKVTKKLFITPVLRNNFIERFGEEGYDIAKKFIERMNLVGEEESIIRGLFDSKKYDAMRGKYVPHVLNSNTVEESEQLYKDVTGTWSPEILGLQKNFGYKRSNHGTISDINNRVFVNDEPVKILNDKLSELYLYRVLSSNKIIASHDTKNFIIDVFGSPAKTVSKNIDEIIYDFFIDESNAFDAIVKKSGASNAFNTFLKKFDGKDVLEFSDFETTSNHAYATYEDIYKPLKKLAKTIVYDGIDPAVISKMSPTERAHYDDAVFSLFNELTESFIKLGYENFGATYSPNVFFQKLTPQQAVITHALNTRFTIKANLLSDAPNRVYSLPDNVIENTNKLSRAQQIKLTSEFLNFYDRFLNIWKLNNTIIHPGFHLQNSVSNAFQSFLAIGEDALNPKSIKKAYDIFKNPDPKQTIKLGDKIYTYQELNYAAKKYGVVDEMFHTFELSRGQEKGVFSGVVPSALDITDSDNFLLYRIGTKFGTVIEGTQRMNIFMSALKQGKSFDEAANLVNKYLFDYSDLTSFEQNVMKRIIPFYTFMRKNIPMELETMLEQPTTFTGLQKAFVNFEKMGSNEYIGENDRNEWRQEHIQLPFEIDGHTYGISDQLPYNQIERVVAPNKLLGQTTPLIKTPIEATTGKYVYTGMDIESPLDYLQNQTFYTKMNNISDNYEDKTQKDLYIAGQLLGFPIGKIK